MNETTVVERLERLERENRRLRLGMLAVVAVVAALVSLAATRPVAKVMRAERFEVVDAKGVARGSFGVSSYDGRLELALCDKGDEHGMRVRAILGVLANGASVLTLTDKVGNERAELYVDGEGNPNLKLLNDEGKVLWQAP